MCLKFRSYSTSFIIPNLTFGFVFLSDSKIKAGENKNINCRKINNIPNNLSVFGNCLYISLKKESLQFCDVLSFFFVIKNIKINIKCPLKLLHLIGLLLDIFL